MQRCPLVQYCYIVDDKPLGIATMFKPTKGMTAGQLLRELEKDPEYVRRRAEREMKLAKLEAHIVHYTAYPSATLTQGNVTNELPQKR
jgi:hypothetical protein